LHSRQWSYSRIGPDLIYIVREKLIIVRVDAVAQAGMQGGIGDQIDRAPEQILKRKRQLLEPKE